MRWWYGWMVFGVEGVRAGVRRRSAARWSSAESDASTSLTLHEHYIPLVCFNAAIPRAIIVIRRTDGHSPRFGSAAIRSRWCVVSGVLWRVVADSMDWVDGWCVADAAWRVGGSYPNSTEPSDL